MLASRWERVSDKGSHRGTEADSAIERTSHSSYFEEQKEQDTPSVWGIFTVVRYPIFSNEIEKHRDPLVCCWHTELCSLLFIILIQGMATMNPF